MKDSELVAGLIEGVWNGPFGLPERTRAADAVPQKIFAKHPNNDGEWPDEKEVDKRQDDRGIDDGEGMGKRHPPYVRYMSDSAK
ncbi:MAG TPA: hypothetical protein VMH23_12940 [Bacteroidota bacterium]|nr:hypothetical protein [Bacteroidota bacterium]